MITVNATSHSVILRAKDLTYSLESCNDRCVSQRTNVSSLDSLEVTF